MQVGFERRKQGNFEEEKKVGFDGDGDWKKRG